MNRSPTKERRSGKTLAATSGPGRSLLAARFLSTNRRSGRRRRRRRRKAALWRSPSTSHLPIELTTQILSRSPVKSLLRFTSVCKTWYVLIKSLDFISEHLSHFALNPNAGFSSLLVDYYNVETKVFGMSLELNDVYDGPVNIDFPFFCGRFYCSVVGICNGLVCMSFSKYGCPLILCNPATRQFREIPHYKWWDKRGTKLESVSFGFGFDPIADDYKLIRN